VGVIVQLETVQSVKKLEAIAAVDGVDALFIGPADLSASMGHVGQTMHPAVMDLMGQAVQRCKAIGKPVGTIGGDPESVAQYRATGFDYVAVGSDLGLFMQGAKSAISALRTPGGDHVHSVSSGTRGY
jgi:2-dehydro-3-deoxyglucarate aldolase